MISTEEQVITASEKVISGTGKMTSNNEYVISISEK